MLETPKLNFMVLFSRSCVYFTMVLAERPELKHKGENKLLNLVFGVVFNPGDLTQLHGFCGLLRLGLPGFWPGLLYYGFGFLGLWAVWGWAFGLRTYMLGTTFRYTLNKHVFGATSVLLWVQDRVFGQLQIDRCICLRWSALFGCIEGHCLWF